MGYCNGKSWLCEGEVLPRGVPTPCVRPDGGRYIFSGHHQPHNNKMTLCNSGFLRDDVAGYKQSETQANRTHSMP